MTNKMDETQQIDTVGKRLARIRKTKGLTQTELGAAVGVSQRVITYYERETKRPPTHLLTKICKALGTTTDELLGMTEEKGEQDKNHNLWKKLKRAEKLPPADRKTLLSVLEGLLAKQDG